MRDIIKEGRFLIKSQIFYDEDNDGVYEVIPENGGTRLAFKATDEQMIRFLRRIKTKDSKTLPRSYKGLTYNDILQDIKQGVNPCVWIWSNHYPNSEGITEILESVCKNKHFIY